MYWLICPPHCLGAERQGHHGQGKISLALSWLRAAAIIEGRALRNMSDSLAMLATMKCQFVRRVTFWRAYSVPTSPLRWVEGGSRERHGNNEGGPSHSIA
jgi:hypothetical protein